LPLGTPKPRSNFSSFFFPFFFLSALNQKKAECEYSVSLANFPFLPSPFTDFFLYFSLRYERGLRAVLFLRFLPCQPSQALAGRLPRPLLTLKTLVQGGCPSSFLPFFEVCPEVGERHMSLASTFSLTSLFLIKD